MRRGRLLTGGIVALVMLGGALPHAAAAAPPPNDDFADAAELTTGVPYLGDTTEATSEQDNWYVGESSHGVWFKWTAPATGLARVDTCGSGFETSLLAFSGSDLATLWTTRIASGYWECGVASMVTFRATAGQTYRFTVRGLWHYSHGDYRIQVQTLGDPGPPPANDDPSGATVLTGNDHSFDVSNAGATDEFGESWGVGTQSVFYRWTSTVDGQLTVDPCATAFPARVQVVEIEANGELGNVTWDESECGDGRAMTVYAFAGREYRIAVGGVGGARGTIHLDVHAEQDETGPTVTFPDPPPAVVERPVLPISWLSSEPGYDFECWLDQDPWYDCQQSAMLGPLADGPHVFKVRARDFYGNVSPAPAEHAFSVVIPEPPNDDLADAHELHLGDPPVTLNNVKATAEPGEPPHHVDPDGPWYYGPNRSVWWTWTSPGDGIGRLRCNVEFGHDMITSVYTGTTFDTLERVSSIYSSTHCGDAFYTSPGETYVIATDDAWPDDPGAGPMRVWMEYEGTGLDPDPDPDPDPGPGDGTDGGSDPGPGPADEPTTGVLDVAPAPGSRRVRVTDGRFKLPFDVRCTGDTSCTVDAAVRAKGRRLARARLDVAPGATLQPALRLNRRGRKALTRRRVVRATAVVGGRRLTIRLRRA